MSVPPPPASVRLLTLILGLLLAIAPLGIDMYLPALPEMGATFAAGQAEVLLTLSTFLIGFGTGQLLWGPVSDRFGRRLPALVGIGIFVAASAACALAGDVSHLVVWRFVEALGGCAGPVVAQSMVRDLYDRNQAARRLSFMMLVMNAAPLLAPLIGGQVLAWFGWRAIFWVLALFGLLSFAGVAGLPESLPRQRRVPLSWSSVLGGYLGLLTHPRFIGYALSSACFFGGMFAYISGTPYVYIEYFGVDPAYYGLLFGVNVIGMTAVVLVNARLVVRHGPDRLLRPGVVIAALAGLWLAAAGLGGAGLVGLMVPLFVYLSMVGLIAANSMSGALSVNPQRAGTAAALGGALQFAVGSLAGAAVGWFADGTPRPMTLVIAGLGLAALIINRALVRHGADVNAAGLGRPAS